MRGFGGLMGVLMLAGSTAVPVGAQEAALAASPWVAAAESFVRLLERGSFDSAALRMAPGPARDGLPAAKLKEVWEQLGSQVGQLMGLEPARVSAQDGMQLVELTARFERQALLVRVVLTATEEVAGLWFLPVPAPASAVPAYADASTFVEEEVTFGEAAWRLPGTFSLPRGAGRVAAVVLVGGSGPIDRDGTIGPNRAYRDLAWGLATRGVAVLRYDKRTRTHAARVPPSITVEEEVIADAVSALALARSHPRVDAHRVYLVGHSLGGMLAPEIARRDGALAGVAMLAAPARGFADILDDQLAYIASLPSSGDASTQTRLGALRDTVRLLRERKLPSDAVVLGATAGYVYDLDARGLAEGARRLGVPLLILQGGRDYQSRSEDLALWRERLAGVGRVEFEEFPELNHLFIPGRGLAVPDEYQKPGHPDVAVVDRIARWVGRGAPAS